MVAWAAILPAIKAAGGAIATGAKAIGGKVAASKVGGALASGKTALQANLLGTALKNTTNGLSDAKTAFANSLLSGNNNSSMPQQNPYQFEPIMTDYSQYMGLSPETQRYLYGGR